VVWLYGGSVTINDWGRNIKSSRRYVCQVKAHTDENPRIRLAVARGMAAYGNVEKVRRAMDVAQTMINLAADQLDDLRSQCSVNAPLTQKEIRQMEVRGFEGRLSRLCRLYLARENQDRSVRLR